MKKRYPDIMKNNGTAVLVVKVKAVDKYL
jgi:hypothetical protein